MTNYGIRSTRAQTNGINFRGASKSKQVAAFFNYSLLNLRSIDGEEYRTVRRTSELNSAVNDGKKQWSFIIIQLGWQ